MKYKNKRLPLSLYLLQSFIIEGKTVLIKFHHLIRIASAYRKDLNLVRIIVISKMDYKLVLYKIYFSSRLKIFCKIPVQKFTD
jgi:hypothetical protein